MAGESEEIGRPPGTGESPPRLEEQVFVAATAHLAEDSAAGGRMMISRFKATFHGGSLPSAEVLRELDEVYPDASKIIFEDFQAQSAHRREREREVVATKNLLAVRGQLIGGFLGMIGLVGSTVVAGLGQGLAGFGIAMLSVGSLVSVFVVGREAQKGERKEKAKLIEQIKRGVPIDVLEEGVDPEKRSTKPSPTKRPPDSRTKTKTKK